MSENDEKKEIKEWIRKKIEKINTKQSEVNTSKINEFENEKKSDNLEMNEHKREDVDKLVKKENRLIKRFKLLVIALLLLNSGILFSYIYLKHFLSEPIILKIYENQYNYSTIKLKGTLIYFWASPKTGKGIGYIENDGYVISILNLTNLNYTVGDVIETNSSIIKGVVTSLESLSDRKIGKSKITPKKELSIENINKNPKNYEWLLIGIKNAIIESINITSTLPSIYNQQEYYVMKIKIKGLGIDSYYVGPNLNIETGKSYNLLAAVLKSSNEVYIVRIFNIY
jgi:hypothetical protein